MPDVFAHGMLSMAWLGRLLTQWVDQRRIRHFGVRFVGITQLGDEITCSGKVVEKFEAEGEQRVKVEIATTNQHGEARISARLCWRSSEACAVIRRKRR